MSTDNAIFILDHPQGYAVVEHTLSAMPMDICGIFHKKETCYGKKLEIFSGKDAHNQASTKALAIRNYMRLHQMILEYGIKDWRNPNRDYRPEFHITGVLL